MGRCTVVKSATIVKRSWDQEKYTLPWPCHYDDCLHATRKSEQSIYVLFFYDRVIKG
jgi:hypothetical protein